jgi:hypothetical protein
MSYLVLGLGAFLSLCGAIAIYTGSGIIQVERGWASVIAGSMAFSCGIVTVALGLILHRLASLHAHIKSREGDTPPRDLAWRTDHEPSPDFMPESSIAPESSFAPQPPTVPPVPPMAAAPSIPSPRSWPQRPMRSNLTAARNLLKPRGTILPTARGTAETDYSSQNAPPLSRNGLKNQSGAEPVFEPGFAIPAEVAVPKAAGEAETWAAFSPAGETPAERPWRLDSEPGLFDEAVEEKTDALSFEKPFPEIPDTPGERSEPGVSGPAGIESFETIFEQELFIELDEEPESHTGGPASSPDSTQPASLDAAPPVPPATAITDEPAPEAPPVITGEGQEELAITGQYQSAGTSYVMYSDGSIEARTEHAVFHFKSMTELKTFMDSDAQTSKE